ncbi:MAG: hypothetical protein H0V62_05295 [Gammaproteobacteria bacterium]|nr:hypothetical protein [Gammaproteobacteria bacterium]
MPLNFRTRFLAALVFVIAGVMAPIVVVVYSAIRASMIEHAQVTLEIGARVFGESMRERNTQLLYAARQAASDFGFKEAVATEDVPTIRSALENYKRRLGAREALVLSLDGKVMVSTSDLPEEIRSILAELVREAENKQFELATVVFGSAPHQLVAVPVETPERVAWAVMGFVLDDVLVAKLKALTGLEVSFVGYSKSGRNADMPLPSTFVGASTQCAGEHTGYECRCQRTLCHATARRRIPDAEDTSGNWRLAQCRRGVANSA